MQIYGVVCGPKEIVMKVVNPFEVMALDDNEYRKPLSQRLQEMEAEGRRFKIYRTYVMPQDRPQQFVFTTTSKDLHLELGCLGRGDQVLLARFLAHEIGRASENQALVVLNKQEEDHRPALLVTMTKHSDYGVNFTFSPVR